MMTFWGKTLGFNENRLTNLFRNAFRSEYLDNYPKSLTRQCYRGALPVREKLPKRRVPVSPTCPRCGHDDETVLYVLVQCPEFSSLVIYAEHMLSDFGKFQLSAEIIIMIVLPIRLTKKGEVCPLCTVAVLKEYVWWIRMLRIATGSFILWPRLAILLQVSHKEQYRATEEAIGTRCIERMFGSCKEGRCK